MLFYTKNSCIFATEMKVLFLVYHGFSAHSGISKKIHYQVKGLRESGHDVRLCYYDFADNGHRCRYVDGNIIKNYGSDPSLRSCLHRKLFIDEHENQRDLVKTDHI